MKKIGLIGGMSWESSMVYYELINLKVRELLGGFHSARCVMESVDFAKIEKLQHNNDWDGLADIMVGAAQNLEKSGADIIVLCTNTMHLLSDQIKEKIAVPFLHIAESTGKNILKKKISKVALLGTKFTMEKDFYKKILLDDFNIHVIIPEKKDRGMIHDIIYQELVHGIFTDESRKLMIKIIKNLELNGAEGVILGCTEIPLLIKQKDVDIHVFDTTKIHVEDAVSFALDQ
ncbi:MAG: aspartate/glutamate racemase family protein [Flavobacteriaceae bacterium]|nr:aspartate/glutamate racemase family protein [Flavobacteriaceae bacterium]